MKKNKLFTKKTAKGSVSIMLAFMMLPVYTFAGTIVDAIRVSSARQMASDSADLAANAGLSDFDSVLKSVYGLFAVSSTEEELQENLYDYFYRTVNNTALTSEDESGRKYIDGIAGLFSNPSEFQFDNLINLNTEAFNAEFTEGAVLADPAVLKSQVTEYMKYTGPLKMSSGLINKLGVFKDFKAQNDAVDARVEYDKSLEKINNICRKIWEDASAYNNCISGADLSGSENLVSEVRDKYRDAISDLEVYKVLKDRELPAEYNEESEKYISSLADDAGVSVLDVSYDVLSVYLRSADGTESEFMRNIREIKSEGDFNFISRLSEQSSEITNVCSAAFIYLDELSRCSDEERKNREKESARAEELYTIIHETINEAWSLRENRKNNADNKCREAADLICSFTDISFEASQHLKSLSSSLEKLLDSIDDAEEAGQNWQDAISRLSDGEVKTSMQNEYDNGVKALSREDISKYREVTEKNLGYFKNIISYAESVRFHDKKVVDYFDYAETYMPLLSEVNVFSVYDAENAAANEINNAFFAPDSAFSSKPEGQGEEYNFYKYLKSVYGKEGVKERSKKESKKLITAMNALGNPEEVLRDACDENKTDILSVISSEKLEKIKKCAELPESNPEFEVNHTDDNAESMLEGQQELLENAGSFLGEIGSLSETVMDEGIENLLVTEYIMQMFSCQTSGKECSGGSVSELPQKTLTGIEMNKDNNVFYQSEVEYLLWGNEDMEKNLQYTGSLIFGTRFALNSVYAFTDSEIRTVTLSAATAIAGWTGFGIPVVKTVLILSLALAESVSDLDELLDGNAVPVYKNSSTWKMKPSGLVNALVNESGEIAELAVNKAGKKVEDIFEKIENSAEDGIDSLTETVNDYVDEFADESIDAAENTIKNVLFAAVISVIENAEEYTSEEKISAYLAEKINSVESSGNDISSAAVRELKNLLLEETDRIAAMISQKCSSVTNMTSEKAVELSEEICEKTEEIIDSLRESVKESIGEVGNLIKKNAVSGISGAGEYATEYAKDFVGNMVSGAATELTEKFGGAFENVAASKNAVSPASAVTLTYKEYLRIFLLLNGLSETKERAVLTRMAVLIDVNMNNGMKNAYYDGEKISVKENFDISSAPTMITVDADVSVKTWFLSAFVPDFGKNENDNESDSSSSFTDRKKIISVRSVLSY